MPYDLGGLRILVTRPKPQGEALCEAIIAAQGVSFYLPVITFAPPANPALVLQQISQLDQYDWLVFISPQAVIASAPLIHQCWSKLPKFKIAAVGEGTAQALQDANLPTAIYPQEQWNSEGVLALAEFAQVENQKVALISGVGGRDLLENSLAARGAIVTKIAVYQRCMPTVDTQEYIDLLKTHSIDIIVVTSVQSMRNLQELVGENYLRLFGTVTVIVVSERTAAYAKELGFGRIVKAENASNAALLQALLMVKQQGQIMQTKTDEAKTAPACSRKKTWILALIILAGLIGLAAWGGMQLNNHYHDLFSQMQNKAQENTDQITSLQKNIVDLSQTTANFSDQLKADNTAVATLQQSVNSGKRSWHVVQASYLVTLAKDNLQFEQNVEKALELMEAADHELINIDDPNLLTIRRALAADIESLRATPKIDVTGLYARILALNQQVDSLPMVNRQAEKIDAQVTADAKPSWWRKGLQETWKTLREIVVIRYSKNGVPPLVSPEQHDYLYQNIHAKLDNAAWAVLHKNAAVYQTSLTLATDWVARYFVQDAPVTQSLLTALTELKQQDIQPNVPSIAASVQAFTDYFANSEAAGSTT